MLPEYFSHSNIKPSFGELKVMKHLDLFDVEYLREVSFAGLVTDKGREFRFDFFIPSLSLIIEYDGKAYHSSSSRIAADNIKNKFARKHGIRVIRIQGFKDVELIFKPYAGKPITNKVVPVKVIKDRLKSDAKQPKIKKVKSKQIPFNTPLSKKDRAAWKPIPLNRRAIT